MGTIKLICEKCGEEYCKDGTAWRSKVDAANIFYRYTESIIRCTCGKKIGIMLNKEFGPGEVIPV